MCVCEREREWCQVLILLTTRTDGSDECALSLGEQVVWLSDDYPEFGVVRWKGKLAGGGGEAGGWKVGVEFVSQSAFVLYALFICQLGVIECV